MGVQLVNSSLGFLLEKQKLATVSGTPLNPVSGSRPPLVLLVLAGVLLLSSGRAGQPCVLFLSSWFLSLVFLVSFSCPPGVLFLSPWRLQLLCCCPLAALANTNTSRCPPLVLLISVSCCLGFLFLLCFGRAGQACVLLLSSWFPSLVLVALPSVPWCPPRPPGFFLLSLGVLLLSSWCLLLVVLVLSACSCSPSS